MAKRAKQESDDPIAAKRKERLAAIGKICDRVNTGKWGGDKKDAVQFFGGTANHSIVRLPTGSRQLDRALGGGWPFGRMCELFGPESGGKSTLCLHAIANFQKTYPDDNVCFIDSENSFDAEYAKRLGVDVELLMVHQPDHGEQALNILEQMIDEGVRFVIVDSVAALVTVAELEGEIGDSHVAVQARLMSQALKRLCTKINKSNTIVLFTNQLRDNINARWGDKSTTPGGRALKFYSTCRVEVVRIGSDKEGEVVVSNRVKATVKKNKVAPPFRVANFNITFGIGVDEVCELFDDAVANKVIKKAGNTFTFGEQKLGVGKGATLDTLRNNSELVAEIDAACKAVSDEEDNAPVKRAKGQANGEENLKEVDATVVEEEDEEMKKIDSELEEEVVAEEV